jgi:hypothetical protein
MSRFLGRDSRRRRVLNEEALSASSAHLAMRAGAQDEPAEGGPRYSDAAGVEHHPQVTDFFPRRFRTIGALAAAGVVATAVVEALHWFVAPLAATYGFESAAAFDLTGAGSLANWLSAVILLLASVTCVLIYSLRRHRIDDFKGRYRVWMAAAAACVLLSIGTVAPLHRLVVTFAAYHTGWTALRGHAAWWLVLGGLPLGWIALRACLDARESRLAAVALGAAITSYGVALATYLGIGPALAPHVEVMVTAGATLMANWLVLVGVVSYGRFVVLDAQGLIPVRASSRADSKSKASVKASTKDREVKNVASRTAASASGPLRSFRENLSSSASETPATEWVDGSDGEVESYDDSDGEEGDFQGRRLSKLERKRLRKQKRAA